MNLVLIKLFATALAFSQVATRPEAIKTEFNPATDQAEVVQLLRAGCGHMRKAFDIEDINLDDLIATAMDDPKAIGSAVPSLGGLDFGTLHIAYRRFCKDEAVDPSGEDIAQTIAFYNKAMADLPDPAKLKGLKLPGMSTVLDRNGARFAELFEPQNRRVSIPLADMPDHLIKAFIAAEDKRFYEHTGIDERGLIRAMIGNLMPSRRPQGGSTITQQVAKLLLVGDDVTYERKMREMVAASRIERLLSKNEILELYLNSIYLGRGVWGVEMAARSYFGKPIKDLTLPESAVLASLAKGPSAFDPDRYPDRLRERIGYVLTRMQENGAIDANTVTQAQRAMPQFVSYARPRRDSGFHFSDQVAREAKAVAGIESLTGASYTVQATIDPALQRASEAALQEGLARYELSAGRAKFSGAEMNLAAAIKKLAADPLTGAIPSTTATMPHWQTALMLARLPLYDVHWQPAIILEKTKQNAGTRVGLTDGRTLSLSIPAGSIAKALQVHDVVYVRVAEAREGKTDKNGKPTTTGSARAELRVRPQVQGAALVLENKTGRILAMAGAFSYPLSQLNRVSQSQRQPGSAFKPLVYLAALRSGLQPNTLFYDTPISLPPVDGGILSMREEDNWTPKNYDGGGGGILTMRRALEKSRNLVTARLLEGGIETFPEGSLDKVCKMAVEVRFYKQCQRYYPVVLGAQPVRMIDLAAFYAGIANGGAMPVPHAIETIERNGSVVYKNNALPAPMFAVSDPVAAYQLKTMLQGVVARGTAVSIKHLAPYVGGKTGTSDNENDVWFVGFTNDVTVAVWAGYDNADGKRRTLGRGQTGAKVALPIFTAIVEAGWASGLPKTALAPPIPEAERSLVALPIDLNSGDYATDRGQQKFVEYFRKNATGEVAETQHNMVPAYEAAAMRDGDQPYGDSTGSWPYIAGGWRLDQQHVLRAPPREPQGLIPAIRGLFGEPRWFDDEATERAQPRRQDPDYVWGRRPRY
jgi:membrane carboxypeptidase/penicillin-binding protein